VDRSERSRVEPRQLFCGSFCGAIEAEVAVKAATVRVPVRVFGTGTSPGAPSRQRTSELELFARELEGLEER
jgi:hypothetical protein